MMMLADPHIILIFISFFILFKIGIERFIRTRHSVKPSIKPFHIEIELFAYFFVRKRIIRIFDQLIHLVSCERCYLDETIQIFDNPCHYSNSPISRTFEANFRYGIAILKTRLRNAPGDRLRCSAHLLVFQDFCLLFPIFILPK